MGIRLAVAAFVLALSLTACATREGTAGSEGAWVGTITTEGIVTTVVSESGSVWGGTARLVEEASIGVEAGPEEYMLGSVGALWATDREIYVIDTQLPAVRVYDRDGRYLRDVGSAGQGPGEYVRPSSVYVDPSGLVYVHDTGSERMNVYGPDGVVVDTWAPTEGSRLLSDFLLVTLDGRFFASASRWLDMTDPSKRERFQQEIGPEGPIGAEIPQPTLGFEPATLVIRLPGRTATWGIPFMPYERSRFLPTGAWVIGVPDDYHFEIRHADGRVTRVRKYWEPVPVSADEAAYRKQWTLATVRAQVPDFAWNGPEVPDIKPAFVSFTPTFDDRFVVLREGPSRRVEPCDERFEDRGSSTVSCFQPTYSWDVFEQAGRYLGELERPDGRLGWSFFRDDLVLLAVEDDAGTIMVKRYRLVLPGEGS